MNDRLELHYLEKQKVFYKKKIAPLKMISSAKPIGWTTIDNVVWAVIPMNNNATSGLLLPIKETEEFLKTEYKKLFGIEIPNNIHQWPYSIDEDIKED